MKQFQMSILSRNGIELPVLAMEHIEFTSFDHQRFRTPGLQLLRYRTRSDVAMSKLQTRTF